MNIQVWAVVVSALGVIVVVVGGISQLYSRIGRLEGKLNGTFRDTFRDLCETTKKNTDDINTIKTDVGALKEDVNNLKEHPGRLYGKTT